MTIIYYLLKMVMFILYYLYSNTKVLEPICEPKFHNHSYGFRQNRDAHHAVSRVVSMVNMYKHYYCVDVDIKGFFDNVDHGKLLKQIWTLGHL